MTCLGLPMTSWAKATFSNTVLFEQQLEVLEDVADVAAQLGHAARRHVDDVPPGHPHGTSLGAVLAVEQPQQRALARPGRADEEHELALGHVEAGVAERDDIVAVGLGDVLESDHVCVGFMTKAASDYRRQALVGTAPRDRDGPPVQASTVTQQQPGASGGSPP